MEDPRIPLSEFRALFRFCPACGKHFEVRLVSKKLTSEKEVQETTKEVTPRPAGMFGLYSTPGYVTVEENIPITVDVKEFQYTYRCKHCGHQWTEIKDKERRA
jgi:predicted RNA-binding Zn-ribbon protein involved in translation (DUF1610 family)